MGTSEIILIIAVAALIILYLRHNNPPHPPVINLCTTQMKTIILEAGIVFNRLQTWWMSFLTKVGLNKSGIVSQDPLTNAIQRMRYTISSLHVTNQTSKSVYEIMNSELARFGTVTKYVNGVGQKLLYSGKYSSDLKIYNSFFSSTDNISAHLISEPIINYCRA